MEKGNPPPATSWHVQSAEAVAALLFADAESGLGMDDVARRRAREGFNELPEAPPPSLLNLFLSQFTSIIVWVLIGAAIVSGLLEDWLDAAAILAIVVLNGLLGFIQEFRAERSLSALRKMSVAMARVVRRGILQTVPARDLVSGDLILLEAGDRIPADARLVYTTNFQTQEASLTGESTPVQKEASTLGDPEASLADRINMAFMGTVAVSGKARALVVATALRTELGRIAAMIRQATEAERVETPLQRRLEHFGYTLLWLALGVVAVVFGLGYWRGEPLLAMFLTAVSLAVAAVPEGLPAVVTITLALGVTRMVKRHALIRKLPAVETLGSATVICTDKTGTLTKNEMTVTRLFVGDVAIDVTGEGYAPVGTIREASSVRREANLEVANGQLSPVTRHASLGPAVRELLTAAVLCNGATLREEHGIWQVIGDPTEGALLVVAAKAGIRMEALEPAHRLLGEVPFDSERKRMTMVRRTPEGIVAFVKGAPDILLQCCTSRMTGAGGIEPLTEDLRRTVLDANAGFAHDALRVLALARRSLGTSAVVYRPEALERDLVFLGLVAMKDPVRPEAVTAIRRCRAAGIRTVMITGDHKETAVAIAGELGLMTGDGRAMAGSELDRMPDEDLARVVERVAVYARVAAEHKLRIVEAWKRRGAIVAMTGDGVNDAPAIKAADIGVAMGLTGTDVTKEAADMVVTDDNFASIAAAVEEGRGVFDNIRKTIHYLLSCNFSEILLMFGATVLGLPLPLLPIQILWINLVTDGLPALALAVDPKDPDLMHRSPRPPTGRIFTNKEVLVIFGEGMFLGLIAILAFAYCLYGMDLSLERARTLTFTIMVLVQLAHALNCRNDRRSLLAIGVWTNKPLIGAIGVSALLQVGIAEISSLHPVFKVASFDLEHWLLAFGVGVTPLLAMEVKKLLAPRR